jgi:hypothetical protein
MIYFVDIDETICYYETEEKIFVDGIETRNYLLAKPCRERIVKINKLYEEGNSIVYWTARGSITGLDWTALTGAQLKHWGAKHHKLILGKPYYDVFIDDKNINSDRFFGENNE